MNIHEPLCNINSKIGAITKGQTNKSQNFKYRGIDDVMNDLHALFAENKVIILPVVTDIKFQERPSKSGGILRYTHLTVNFIFTAEDGSNVTTTAIGEAMDSGDKGTSKAMSVALKMVLLEMFLIPTEDPKDPDGETHEPKAKTLTDAALAKALDRIKNGENELIKKIQGTYSLTEKQQSQLELTISNLL